MTVPASSAIRASLPRGPSTSCAVAIARSTACCSRGFDVLVDPDDIVVFAAARRGDGDPMWFETAGGVVGDRFEVQCLVAVEGAADDAQFHLEALGVVVAPPGCWSAGNVVGDGFQPGVVVEVIVGRQHDERAQLGLEQVGDERVRVVFETGSQSRQVARGDAEFVNELTSASVE